MIKIKATKEGFRRAGVAHSKTFKEYPDDFFSEEQLAQLEAEPMIVIEQIFTELKTHPGTGEKMIVIGEEGPGVLDTKTEPKTKDPELSKDVDEEAQARKVLEKMTNNKLKSECDAMGIEYPDNAIKADLVDLILKNTAPPPEG